MSAAQDSPNSAENPYAAPLALSVVAVPVNCEGSLEEDVRLFVGPRADFYLKRWLPFLAGLRANTGFNWPCFFLGGVWMAYRKMYLFAAVYFGFFLVVGFVEAYVFDVLRAAERPVSWDLSINLTVAVVCGLFGNRWYLAHAQRVTSNLREQGFEEPFYRLLLTKRGGTSITSAIGFMVLSTAAMVVTTGVLEFVINPP